MSVKRSVKYNYESLANAVVKQAYDDFIDALKPVAPGHDQHIKRDHKTYMRDDVESFFRGGWYGTLTALPPEILTRAAFKEKQRMITYDWLDVVNRAKWLRFKKKRKCNFAFRKNTSANGKNKINDKRHEEYEAKVKWRKHRIKDEDKRYGKKLLRQRKGY